MKFNRIFLSISLVIIFSMLLGLGISKAQIVQPQTLTSNMSLPDVIPVLPRDQTLYFNSLQWGSINGWNPYSSGMNNALAINQGNNARITVFETPYMFNMLTGETVPLLANGPIIWDTEHTQITFAINLTAHWSDGTPVTPEDVAYTWTANVDNGTDCGNNYRDFIDSITAVSTDTVNIAAVLNPDGEAVNAFMVEAYLSSCYVVQKAWTQIIEARHPGDPDGFKNDPAEDFVASGPYKSYYADDQVVMLIRDDNYWGADTSMWGRLPAPKYLAHVIYPDDGTAFIAFKAGLVDVSQMFIPNVQDLWLVDHLRVSTYLPEAPYQVGATMPTAFYNLEAYGLDNPVIRKAIAIAIDYNAIIANAMSGQSATFEQVPRSLMNPTDYEQSLYDHEDVADLQWTGSDVEGAKALLDGAGIVDTNMDGWREYSGVTLHYTATCPNGWWDWMAAIEIIAAAGQAIGIDITTNFPEWGVYQNVVTNWSVLSITPGYEIFMMWSDGAGPAEPWSRIRKLLSSEYAGMDVNWNGNWGGYANPDMDAIIAEIPIADPTALKGLYTDAVEIYLTDTPSFTLMYRPEYFHAVNSTIWIGFPNSGDGMNIPPLNLINGYSIAGLYNLKLVQRVMLPVIVK